MKPVYSGKIREIYDIPGDRLVIVTTDRISAFDHILPATVDGKGIVLNKLSNFWFRKTQHIVPNHIISEETTQMPSFFQDDYFKDRTVMVQKLSMLPFEFVVRGYLFGSMWNAYEKNMSSGTPSEMIFCGNPLPAGYKLAQKLDSPVMTPAVKCSGASGGLGECPDAGNHSAAHCGGQSAGHDEYVDIKYVEAALGAGLTAQITQICFALYETCSRYALSKGFLIADAKFEFGKNQEGQLVLADEIFTPDSGRFWDAADYRTGVSPKSYDKQFLRDWLLTHKVNGEFQFDRIPDSVLRRTGRLYEDCLRRLTGD